MLVALIVMAGITFAGGYLVVGFQTARPVFHRSFDNWYENHKRRYPNLNPLSYRGEGLAVARSKALCWTFFWPLLWAFRRLRCGRLRLTWGEPLRLREQRIEQLEREAGLISPRR